MMHVRLLSESDARAYDTLAAESGKVFYSPQWAAAFNCHLQRFGVFDGPGRLVAGFHVFCERRFGSRLLRNPPFTPVCGPFMSVKASHPVAVLESRRRILEAMADFLASQGRAIVSLSLDHDITDLLPFHWRRFKVVPRYTYVTDLRQSLADIVKGFSPARRNDVSKARRDGLRVEPVTDLEVVEQLVRKTFGIRRARVYPEALRGILYRFASDTNSYGFVTRKDGRAIACTFIVHDRHTAYYLLGGYDSEAKHRGAAAIAILESMRKAREMGIQCFDFEGSMIPPIERFFRGFGGRLTPYFSVSRAWLPFELVLRIARRAAFC